MRVIAGSAKGRTLVVPHGLATRPTPARVREALFSILAGELEGARVLDLFAGSGSLGIEALSRGAAQATFVEKAPAAQGALRRNLEAVESARVRVLAMTADRAVTVLTGEAARFNLVLLDPPYASDLGAWALSALATGELLADDAVVVLEHAGRTSPPTSPPSLPLTRTRRFGDVAISLFRFEKGTPAC